MERTYWVTGVKCLIDLRSFSVPDEPGDIDFGALAYGAGHQDHRLDRGYTVVGFGGQKSEIGHLLSIETERGCEHWIVPDGSCFILGDNGKTIDRI